ncbi:MAG TPA: class III signal peptide-containing protein [archaeon]|nr:class III signal peptide-containing protein [archaeon]
MLSGEKAQVSIEMIIILAAVVAIVLLLVSQLQKTAEKGAKVFSGKSDDIFKKIEDI